MSADMKSKSGSPVVEDAELEARNRFHRHLEYCGQCSNHPFNLCATGDRLIREAVAAIPNPYAVPR